MVVHLPGQAKHRVAHGDPSEITIYLLWKCYEIELMARA